MASTTPPLPLPFTLFTIFLNLVCFATAQREFLKYFCINGTGFFPNNSIYQTNLNTLLSSFSSNIDSYGFYNSSLGQGSDTVYSLALCRGDVGLDDCRICVDDSVRNITQSCPNNKDAITWHDYCMLRYSNSAMFGIRNDIDWFWAYSLTNISSSDVEQFNHTLSTMLDTLIGDAANGGDRQKFAVGNATFTTGTGFKRIYGLVQCTPDLSVEDCSSCLNTAKEKIPELGIERDGARVIKASCNFRYEQNQFFNSVPQTVLPRLPPPPPPPLLPLPSGKGDNTITIIIAVVVSSVGSLVLVIFIYIFIRRKKQRMPKHNFETVDEISSADSLQYDLGTIKDATDNFSEANKLGQGGFGVVYKGKLANGEEIAVKRLSKDSAQGVMEFKNEVTLMAKLQHRNLVRLIGFCFDDLERILIYEFMPNSSLDHFIFDPLKRACLDWEIRSKIIEGIARGLLYLHEDSRLRIVHRDLKVSNVLLDQDMNPKISDFGMARLFGTDETQGNTRRVVGTFGYMAPEYVMHGQFSVKSDVFSFGVLVLETISGQKNNCFQNEESVEHLLTYTWKNWRSGTTTNVIDPNLRNGSYPISEIIRCIHIGLLCVQENVTSRPTMASIVLMFNSFSISLPLPSKPAYFLHSTIDNFMESSKSKQLPTRSTHLSDNEASITELSPR